jgi:hypothetical protein
MKKKNQKVVPKKKDEREILAGIIAFAAGVCYLIWRIFKK